MNVPIDTVIELLMCGIFDSIQGDEHGDQRTVGVCVSVARKVISAANDEELRVKVREYLETFAMENANAAD